MGRSPRAEPAEQEKPPAVRPSQTFQPAPPQAPQQRVAERQAEQVGVAEAVRPQSARPEAEQQQQQQQRPPSPRAVSETEGLARDLREGVLSGFVGGGTVLTGDAEFKGMLRIDGRFTGRIKSEKGTLIVSAGGRIDANLWVGTAKVNGIVNGDITAAERIELGRSAQVRGQIQTPILVVEQGAVFEGGCRMTQRAEPAESERPPETVAASTRPLTPPAAARPRPTAAPQPQPLTPPKMPAAATAPDAGGVGASAQSAEV
jgi:cytoskeletal protein CcmA (bactofilin family)